jgi:hypothetical protein
MITLLNNEHIKFIRSHYNDDLVTLSLHKQKYKNIDVDLAIKEIASRKKLEKKMPDWVENYEIIMPQSLNIEQSSSYLTAKFKAELNQYETSLDLSCGFGIDSYYLSLKSLHHLAIEPDRELSEIIRHNFQVLGITNCDFINSDAERFLERCDSIFDFVYIDPSRRNKTGSRKILLEDYKPDIIKIFPDLKRISRRLVIKVSPMLDITYLINHFPEVNKIYILSVNGECKEILLVFDFLSHINHVQIHAVELNNNKFEYIFEKDEDFEVNYGLPQKYLYDVHPSIMKTGFHDHYAMSLGLMKISRNSHLYTSDILLNHFSGKVFELKSICKPQINELKSKLINNFATVIRKDFPLTVDQIRTKYKIEEGDKVVLFAVKLLNDKNAFLISGKIR